jgi:lambda family phage portal protein
MGFFSNIAKKLWGSGEKAEAVELAEEKVKPPSLPFPSDFGRVRRYDAAVPTLTQADWQSWLTSGSYEILHASRILRAKARDLERNNPHVRAFSRELCNNVLGASGIRFFSRVPNLKGPNLNKKLNASVQDGWQSYRRKENFEVRKKWTGLECDKIILQRLAVDGEVLLQLVPGYNNEHRFAVQMIECDSLDIFHNSSEVPNKRIVMGVEMDDYGCPTGYNLLDYPQTSTWVENVPMKRHYVPARDLIQIYLPDRMSSVRGVTWLASNMTKLRTLERYEEAVAIGNRLAAAKMGFLESQADAQPYEGQGQTPSGETIEEIVPGIMVDLPYGKTFKPFDPKPGPQTYGDFRKGCLRSISAGLGIMYNTLSNDLESVNYSSARFGKDIENENWRGLQTFLADHYLQDVFAAWLPYAILSGKIEGALMTQKDSIVLNTRWAGRGFPYVDPQKEVQSTLNAIDGGLTTRRRELEEKGLELEEVYDELAEEQEYQDEKGLVFANPANKNPQQPSVEDPGVSPGEEPAPPEEEDDEGPEPAAPKPAPKKPSAKKPAKGK